MSRTYMGIIGFIVLIVLFSGCISSSDDTEVTEVNKTADGIYFTDNISFKCPDNWLVLKTSEKWGTIIVAFPINENSSNSTTESINGTISKDKSGKLYSVGAGPQFEVYIFSNDNKSDQEAINYVKEDMIINESEISSSTVEIDGITAYKDLVYIDNPDEPIRLEYIYFIKNGKTYFIKFTVADKNYDSEKSNFNIILNSFKVD